MWDLIVSVPDHCLSFTLIMTFREKKQKRKRTLITYSLYFSQHKKISVFYHKFGYDSLFLAATIDIQMSSKSVFVI